MSSLSNIILQPTSLSHVQYSIPMRNEYSDRIKVKIWGDKVETIEALGKFDSLMCTHVMHISSFTIHSLIQNGTY